MTEKSAVDVVTIQPRQTGDKLPIPYHINENGTVRRQEYWKGDPAQLAGFMRRINVHEVDLTHEDFWRDPTAAVGMYPVFIRADGSMFNLTNKVSQVITRALGGAR
jgi:hypothetical protein